MFKKGDELVIEVGTVRRHVGLPNTMRGLTPVRARLDAGLDCFAVDTMRTRTILPMVASAFGSGRRAYGSHVTYVRDQTDYRIRCDQPLPAQMDGEYVGEHTDLAVTSVSGALPMVC